MEALVKDVGAGEDAEEDAVLRAFIKAPKFADLATRSKAAASTQAKDKSQLKTSYQMFEDVLDNGTYAGPGSWPMSGHAAAAPAATWQLAYERACGSGTGCVRRPPSHPRTWQLAYERACGSGSGCVRRPTSHPRTWQLAYERACGSGSGCVRRPTSHPRTWQLARRLAYGIMGTRTQHFAGYPAITAHAAGAIDPGIAQGFEENRACEAASKAAKMKLLAALIG
ncbi:hypothetical protein V8C86DRAFT_3182283 [Haematococcus lacustris]